MTSTHWINSELGWLCLNVDGAASLNTGEVSIGGFLRDHTGHFIFDFSKFIGCTNSLHAELWSLLVGLQLAWAHGLNFYKFKLIAERCYSCCKILMLIPILFLLCVAFVNYDVRLGLLTLPGRCVLTTRPLINSSNLRIILLLI
ncbi:hypothetical protein V6N11_008917 [Hibiscus sabdariffa]|uniref:RNase H type-1 domain-containing protein n=2 Tax=Hibiscus sabdariffa TaxID=183260 RepID=A0ABR2PPS8_9ROSI